FETSASSLSGWHDNAAMWRRRAADQLTPREQEVLDLLRRGLTNEEIAGRLDISVPGAKYHVSQILSKLGVATREEAAAWRPEPQRIRHWRWVLIGGLTAIGLTAASALVLVIPHGGSDVQLESQVLRESNTNASTRARSSTGIPRPISPSKPPTPTNGPEITLATTAASEFYVDPEPTADSTPTSASEPTLTP